MFTLGLFRIAQKTLDHILRRDLSGEFLTACEVDPFRDPQQEFLDKVQQIFVERGYEKINGESALDEQFFLFVRNETLHLVYCLPYEMFVTTIEIQTCWDAQCRLGAQSSSVAAPYGFSQAARDKAQSLAIELLGFEGPA